MTVQHAELLTAQLSDQSEVNVEVFNKIKGKTKSYIACYQGKYKEKELKKGAGD